MLQQNFQLQQYSNITNTNLQRNDNRDKHAAPYVAYNF